MRRVLRAPERVINHAGLLARSSRIMTMFGTMKGEVFTISGRRLCFIRTSLSLITMRCKRPSPDYQVVVTEDSATTHGLAKKLYAPEPEKACMEFVE
jgi:hypothetical protein